MNIDAIEAAWQKAVAEDATASFEIIDMLIDNAPSLIAAAHEAVALKHDVDRYMEIGSELATENGQLREQKNFGTP